MFSAFSTGLSGLMKVAQEKQVFSSETDSLPQKTEDPAAPSDADALKVDDAAPDKSDAAAASEGDDVKDSAGQPEGDPILGAAKDWGNFIFGGVKDVTMKVTSGAANATEAFTSGAQMLKKTVEENTILGEFNRQQEQFLEDQKETHAAQEAALPPWMGYAEDEENLKEQILALSSDERHFMRPPPAGVSYQFDYGTSYPIALVTLDADPMLRDMRFKLVPKKIKEEDFWRNYFYRVSLIKQSVALHSMSNDEGSAVDNGGEGEETAEAEGDAATDLRPETEEEIPEWEKELQRELQEYEVVGDAEGNNEVAADPEESEEWQEEIQKMLEQAHVDESPPTT